MSYDRSERGSGTTPTGSAEVRCADFKYPSCFCQNCGELVGWIGRAMEWLFGDMHGCRPELYKQGATYCAAKFGGNPDRVIVYGADDSDLLYHPDDPHQQALQALEGTPIMKMRHMVLENAQEAVHQRIRAERAEAELRDARMMRQLISEACHSFMYRMVAKVPGKTREESERDAWQAFRQAIAKFGAPPRAYQAHPSPSTATAPLQVGNHDKA